MEILRLTRVSLAVLIIALISSTAAFSYRNVDDLSDAWANVSTMIKFIGMGDSASTEEAGNRSVSSIEKALEAEKDSGKQGKIREALGEVRSALNYARNKEWPYAEGSAKRALKLLEDAR